LRCSSQKQRLGDAVQEGAVVADDQGGAAGGGISSSSNLDGEDVQVVGRLVEQQHVGLLGEGLGQGGAAGFAAREALVPFGIEAEGLQGGLGLVVLGAAGGAVVQQGVAGDLRLLLTKAILAPG
jgi:hypothetical protein